MGRCESNFGWGRSSSWKTTTRMSFSAKDGSELEKRTDTKPKRYKNKSTTQTTKAQDNTKKTKTSRKIVLFRRRWFEMKLYTTTKRSKGQILCRRAFSWNNNQSINRFCNVDDYLNYTANCASRDAMQAKRPLQNLIMTDCFFFSSESEGWCHSNFSTSQPFSPA